LFSAHAESDGKIVNAILSINDRADRHRDAGDKKALAGDLETHQRLLQARAFASAQACATDGPTSAAAAGAGANTLHRQQRRQGAPQGREKGGDR
jgi:hypothetical protein